MMHESITVLMIDDDPGDAEMIRRQLELIESYTIDFLHATDLNTSCEVLKHNGIDVVFLDYNLGAQTGIEVLKQLRKTNEKWPVIALTGHGDEYIVRDLMRMGVDDYLAKRDISPDILRRSIESATGRFHRRRLETLNLELGQNLEKKNKILEQKNRRLAELYEAAHEFVDNVSHEFRTPLTVIKEFTSILNDGLIGEVTAEQKEYLETVLDRVDDLSCMIDDMLDTSKLEAGLMGVARKFCTVEEIINRVRNVLERKAAFNRIKLVLPSVESLPVVYCDPEKIGRVIINLAVNAFKFSDENSTVLLWVTDNRDEGVIRIGVTDSGPGIDPEKVSEIFERFQQLNGDLRSSTKGFGLGLNIARELVHLNFGDIDVTSELGRGSTFSFSIPTGDPEKLMNRYLDRIETFRQGSSYVSLISISVEGLTKDSQKNDVECFIQHQIRKSDLVFPALYGGWIVAVPSDQQDLSNLIQRIERAQIDANRNRPGVPLPYISLRISGTWSIRSEREDFIRTFASEVVLHCS